ncbi:MAG: MASE1 domain-containing protein [Acidimicrobiia bacterium]|nr:MASE1 domain-containing protein [Acidimicrobiia bacterium]
MDIDVTDDKQAVGRSWPLLVPFAAVALLHLATARLASLWTLDPDAAQPFWPATGVTVGAALVLSHRHRWWAVAGGLVGHGVNSTVFLDSDARDLAIDLLANGSEMVIGVLFGQWLFSRKQQFDRLSRSLLALVLCMAIAATGATIAALLFDVPDRSDLFWAWTVGDGLGLYAAGSLLLMGRSGWLLDAHPSERTLELGLAAVLTTIVTVLAFEAEENLVYLLIAGVLWLAVRFGPRIAVPGAVLTMVYTNTRTADGVGPFVSDGQGQLFQLQAFNVALMVAVTVVSGLARDTDDKRRSLERSERRWRQLASTGYEGFLEIDRDRNIVDVSEGLARSRDMRVEDVIGAPFKSMFAADEWQHRFSDFAKRAVAGEAVRFDRPYRTRTGRTGWALTSVQPTMTPEGEFDGAMMYVLDTSDLHRLNEVAATSEMDRLNAHDAERERLAHVIHDGALQEIATATMMLGIWKQNPDVGVDLNNVEETLRRAMAQLRIDSIDVGDTNVAQHGIAASLRDVASRFALPTLAKVEIYDSGIGDDSNASIDALFRIGREAMVNAIIHSEGDEVEVQLARIDDGYSLVVTDNGIGFDHARAVRQRGHLGLRTISEQASLAGGWTVTSTLPEGGTQFRAWTPSPDA